MSGFPVTSWESASDQYDYMGRRVVKIVSEWDGGWTQDYEKNFVYDGWNLIEEITSENTVQTSEYYVWGLDLSQSLQGAGGIGGLIASLDSLGSVRYYLYDGNGNVGQVADQDGTVVARYEYDPFGNEIVAEGNEAEGNVFRFSTKYFEFRGHLT